MDDRTHLTPAQRLTRALSGREIPRTPYSMEFTPLDPATLEHLPAGSAVNSATRDTEVGTRALLWHLTQQPRTTTALAYTGVDAEVDAAVSALDAVEIPVTVGDLTVVHRGRIPRPRGSYLASVLGALGVLGIVAAMLGLIPGTASTAQAATAVKGPGLTLTVDGKKVHVGPYRIGGHLLYCTDWGLQLGDGAVRPGTGPVKVSAETRTRLAVIVNTWGNTADNRQAARVKLAMDTLIAPTDAKLRKALPQMLAQMTATDRLIISDPKKGTGMVELSATHAPYKVTVDLAGAVPGQAGRATVTVLGSNGRAAAGRAVAWTVTGGTATSAGKATDKAGHAVVVFRSVALGQSVTATVTSPSISAVWQNTPSRGRQLMIGGGHSDTAKGSSTAELCPVEATHHTVCPCKRAGDREITVRWSAADLTGWYRGTVTVDGQEVGHVDLGAGESGETTIRVRSGQDVEVGYSIYGTAARSGDALVSDVLDAWRQL